MFRASGRAVTGSPLLPSAVGKHVRDLTGLARVHLAHLVEAEQSIAMLFRDAFKTVAGRPPCLQVPERAITAAPHAAGDPARGCLAGAAATAKMEAAAL